MPAADTDRTSGLPTVGTERRRRWPWAVLAGAVALAGGLSYVLRAGGEGARPTRAASEAPASTVTTIGPDAGGSTATTVPPPPTTTQPAPTVTTTMATERLTASSRLSLDGLGPVDIGMTLDEASAAAGTPIRVRTEDPFGPECQYAYAAGMPEVGFMVINGRIERVDVGDRGGRRVTTVSGVGTGDTEDRIDLVGGAASVVDGAPAVEVVVRRIVVGGVIVVDAGGRVVGESTLVDVVVAVAPAPGASSAAPPVAWSTSVSPVVDGWDLRRRFSRPGPRARGAPPAPGWPPRVSRRWR